MTAFLRVGGLIFRDPVRQVLISDLADHFGYTHFNWFQQVHLPPDYQLAAQVLGLPARPSLFIDPPAGVTDRRGAPGIPSDSRVGYWDETGPPSIYRIDSHQFHRPERFDFTDSPASLVYDFVPNVSPTIFYTSLIGVKSGGQFDRLFTWRWGSTQSLLQPGSITYQNAVPFPPEQLQGGLTVLGTNLRDADLPLDILQGLIAAVAANVTLAQGLLPVGTPAVPEPSTLALAGVGGLALAGYGWRRWCRPAA